MNEQQMRRRWFIHRMVCLLRYPLFIIVFFLSYSRLYRSKLSNEENFHLFWLFETMRKSLKSGKKIKYYKTTFEYCIDIDNTYLLQVWHCNHPYSDMKFSLYERNAKTSSFKHSLMIMETRRDREVNFPLAWAMRRTCNILNKTQPSKEFEEEFDLIKHHKSDVLTPVDPETMKHVIAAHTLEVL